MESFILKKYRQYSKPELKVPYKYKTQGTFLWHTIMKSSASDSSEHYIAQGNVPTSCITDFLNALGIMLINMHCRWLHYSCILFWQCMLKLEFHTAMLWQK